MYSIYHRDPHRHYFLHPEEVVRAEAPASEPLTVEEVKDFLRVTDDSEDSLIASLITVARESLETQTSQVFAESTFTASFGRFHQILELTRGPIASVQAVRYRDEHDAEHTLPAGEWKLERHGTGIGKIYLTQEFSGPSLSDDRLLPVTVEFRAGYGADPGDLPETLRHAVRYLVSHYFDQRSMIGVNVNLTAMPHVVDRLIAPYILRF